MTHDVEETLAVALRQRAEHEVDAHALLDGARVRGRRRQRARIAGAAGCAAVLAVVAGVAVTGLSGRSDDQRLPFAASEWSGTVPDFAAADSPEKVWPEAVHRLPATLPDGSGYQVYAVLGGDRYLVRTKAGRVSAPSVFDARSGDVTFLGTEQMRTLPGSSGTDWTAAVGDHAVWFGSVPVDNGKRWHAEVWIARLDGTGDPRKIATVPDHGSDPSLIGVTEDSIYWDEAGLTGQRSATVHRLPVAGGTPQRVPQSADLRLFGLSPWADTADHFTDAGEPTSREGVLWNAETGERRPWVAHEQARSVVCFPLICAGTTDGGRRFVQRLDGTGFRELPYPADGFRLFPAVAGRFALCTVETAHGNTWYVWDLLDDRVAGMTIPSSGDSGIEFGFERSTIQWRADDGSVRVLDLTAVG